MVVLLWFLDIQKRKKRRGGRGEKEHCCIVLLQLLKKEWKKRIENRKGQDGVVAVVSLWLFEKRIEKRGERRKERMREEKREVRLTPTRYFQTRPV